eukprot:4281461-Amphidinium_carterae.1
MCRKNTIAQWSKGRTKRSPPQLSLASRVYPLWGLNPRPVAHKTTALTTELHKVDVHDII